jgi:hypothetical protein
MVCHFIAFWRFKKYCVFIYKGWSNGSFAISGKPNGTTSLPVTPNSSLQQQRKTQISQQKRRAYDVRILYVWTTQRVFLYWTIWWYYAQDDLCSRQKTNKRNTQRNAGLPVYSTLYLRFSLISDVMSRRLAATFFYTPDVLQPSGLLYYPYCSNLPPPVLSRRDPGGQR